jgi:protein-S-isoprenylcysteine O-methyltransferase Ste14
MKPYFATHTLTAVLYAITVVCWVALELRQSRRRRPEAAAVDGGSQLVIRVCVGIALVAAALAPSRVPSAAFGAPVFAFVVGLLLAWTGIALRLWSFRTLGRYFTFAVRASADQPVISAGPYRVLRHPSYAAIELIFVGVGCLYGNWLALAAMTIAPLVAIVYRIRVEERALTAVLGDRYRSYAATRKRMIPGVW